jgi:hypothetical protein
MEHSAQFDIIVMLCSAEILRVYVIPWLSQRRKVYMQYKEKSAGARAVWKRELQWARLAV